MEKKHTVLFVTCCLNVGILSASIGDSNSSERSSTAFSKSLFIKPKRKKKMISKKKKNSWRDK